MRGQSMRYQNILTVQNNSKQEDSIMLLLMSLNEVCLTMPQWKYKACLSSIKKKKKEEKEKRKTWIQSVFAKETRCSWHSESLS